MSSFSFALSALTVLIVVTAALGDGRPAMYLIGDFHYDPAYGTSKAVGKCNNASAPPYGDKDCDSPNKLLESALEDLYSQAAIDGDGIFLITGDILRHKMKYFENASSENYTIRYAPDFVVLKEVAAHFSQLMQQYEAKYNMTRKIKILAHQTTFVEGNEDCIPHYHFELDPVAKKHPSLIDWSQPLQDNGLMTPTDAAQWQVCGYYSHVVNGTNLRVLMINTVIYSVQARPAANVSIQDPCGQFAWIDSEVQQARALQQRVVVLGHIIPDATKWVAEYLSAYRTAIKSYADVMTFQVFGHTHMSTFLTLSAEKAPFVIDVPGITPRDGNMPSYLKLTFTDQVAPSASIFANSTWVVDEIHQRFLDITSSSTPTWQWGKSLPKDFPDMQAPLNTPNLYDFAKKLNSVKDDSSTWTSFEDYYYGGAVRKDMSKKDKAEVTCRMFAEDLKAYETCKKSSDSA